MFLQKPSTSKLVRRWGTVLVAGLVIAFALSALAPSQQGYTNSSGTFLIPRPLLAGVVANLDSAKAFSSPKATFPRPPCRFQSETQPLSCHLSDMSSFSNFAFPNVTQQKDYSNRGAAHAPLAAMYGILDELLSLDAF